MPLYIRALPSPDLGLAFVILGTAVLRLRPNHALLPVSCRPFFSHQLFQALHSPSTSTLNSAPVSHSVWINSLTGAASINRSFIASRELAGWTKWPRLCNRR